MAGRWSLTGKQRRQLEQIFQRIDPNHAVSAEKSICHCVRTGYRAGVRRRNLLSDLGTSELVDDNRLLRGKRAPRRMRQAIRITDRFKKQHDRTGVRVIDKKIGNFADTDIAFVSDRNQLRKTGATSMPAREQSAHHAARLRDDGERSRLDVEFFQHGDHRQRARGGAAVQTDAIGPEQPHTAVPCNPDQFRLPAAARFTGLREAIAVYGRERHVPRRALLDGGSDCLGRHHDERMVDRPRHRTEIGVRLVSENLITTGIDRDDPARVTVLVQEALRPRRVLVRVARRADQRDRLR